MVKNLPLVLLILDGWGYRLEKKHNAIALARTPHWDHWWQTYPHTLLEASGPFVGLPNLQMGNSEVGHMHIGAGRVVPQDFTRINDAITHGDFAKNPVFVKTIEEMNHQGSSLHVLGLFSEGGVHSHEDHLLAFLTLCDSYQFKRVYLHLFLDGRDTPPQSALKSIQKLQDFLKHHPTATLCSITGRYYAMDRDQRYQRIEPLYQLLTESISPYHFDSASDAILSFYQQNISDEFIPPTIIGKGRAIQDDDCVFFFNFRADRARQLTDALISETFQGFPRVKKPRIKQFISMTQYADYLPTEAAFPPLKLTQTLGEVLENHGLRQLRISETEKYAHVTFFLNGGIETPYPHEKRILIPSPKVATYDLQPEMSAKELTQALIEAIKSQEFEVIICNYPNADMVGHTGNVAATIRAIECLDQAMNEVWQTLEPMGGQLLITADHGNAELMFDDSTHQPHTAHTNDLVPFLYLGKHWHFLKTQGCLIDIAPTLLTLLNISPPDEMTGKPLLVESHVPQA